MTPKSTLTGGAASPAEIRTVFAGLMLALALSALDQNIVGTALPRIVNDLGGLTHLSWVVTAFLLTSTTTAPIYGKLSDLYGRKPLFFAAISIFLAGSVLCGVAATMAQLILFRGVQGLGAGGLLTLSQTTIADLVSPRERGRYQGMFVAVFAVSSVAGPLLGGFITDALSWRWIFFVNLPVGLAAFLLIQVGLHRPHRAVAHRIDYAGATLLTAGTSCLLLLLSWGGERHPWLSPTILSLSLSTCLLYAIFIRVERRAKEPMIAPRLFRNPVFLVATAGIGLTFMALMGALIFLPLYLQLVLGVSAAKAGLLMSPMMAGVVVSSVVGGRLVSVTGRYKVFPVAGLVAASAAFVSVSRVALTGGGIAWLVASLVTLGLGLGLVMPNLTVAIQNAVDRSDLGVATASLTFFRSLGGALGAAISGTILTSRLSSLLPGSWSALSAGPPAQVSHGGGHALPSISAPPLVVEAYRQAIGTTFLFGAAVAMIALLVVVLLPELPLRGNLPDAEGSPTGASR